MHSEHDRDALVERLLRRSLQARDVSAPPRASCLDAETLAAWADGTLSREQFAAAEAHAATCPRCQALLGAFARTVPAAPEPWWRHGLSVRWLVPLTAAAIAIAVWVALPRRDPPVLESKQVRIEAPASSKSLEPALPVPASPTVGEEVRARRDRPLNETRDQSASVPEAPGAVAAHEAQPADGRRARRENVAPNQESAAVDGVGRLANASSAGPPAAPPSDARSEPPPASTLELSRSAAAVAKALAIEIVSPDPSIRWRIGAKGVVERSTNGGSSWVAQSTGVAADLTAGASPSPQVCWLVGRAGTVLLTSDGLRWQRVRLPETVDLTAVQASDARTATITAADGRRFSTDDGGATWAPVQGF